jgi:hypothetical protein
VNRDLLSLADALYRLELCEAVAARLIQDAVFAVHPDAIEERVVGTLYVRARNNTIYGRGFQHFGDEPLMLRSGIIEGNDDNFAAIS